MVLAAALPDSAPLVASLAFGVVYVSMGEPGTPRYVGGAPDYDALLALPEVIASPRAAIEIRLARARHDFTDNQDERALAAAAAIRDLPGLAANDPLKIQAMELIVALRAASGDLAAARAAHQAMGAGAPRCTYPLRLKRVIVTERAFPQTASLWGFEGWGIGEAMIGANGAPRTVRTIVAYPAFIFAEAEERVVRTSRYDPILVPDDGACPAQPQTILFRLGD